MAQQTRAKSKNGAVVKAKARTNAGRDQELNQSLFTDALDGIFVCDPRGKYLDVNPRMCKMLGFTRREILRMNLGDLISTDSIENSPIHMGNLLAGKIAVAKMRLRCKNGGMLHVEVHARNLSNGNLVCIVRDVDERKSPASEERYQTVADFTHDWEFWSAPDGQIEYVSPSCYRITGYRAEEFIENPNLIHEIVHPDDRAAYERHLARVRQDLADAQDSSYETEFRIIHRDGGARWIGHVCQNIHRPDGAYLGQRGSNRDITARKQAETRYQSLFDQSHDAIFIIDLQGLHIQANQRAADMLGYTLEEIQNLSVNETSAQVEQSRSVLERLLRGEHIPLYERVFRRKDGSEFPAEVNVELARDADGKPLHIQSVVRDITERKQAEEKLHLQSAALEAAANTIVITDRDGMIEWTNPSFKELTGFEPFEAAGKSPRTLVNSGVQDEPFYKNLWETILSGQVWHGELVNRRKDGRLYKEEMTITPLQNLKGDITHFIAIKQNITERKDAEEALRMAEAKYRAIFEGAVEGIYQSTPDGRFLTANPALARMWGYDSPEDLIASIHDISRQIYVRASRREEFSALLAEQGETRGFEYEAYRKDGGIIWVSENARVVKDKDGATLYYEGNIEDITEQKWADMQLNRMLGIINASLNEIFVFNANDWLFEYVNLGAQHNLGYSMKQLRLMTPLDIKPGFTEEIFRNTIAPLVEGRESVIIYETVHLRADGTTYPVEIHLQLVGRDEDRVFLAVGFDITERMRSQQALHESEERIQNLVRHSSSMFYAHTPDHVLTYVSPQSREILDCDPEEALILWKKFLSDRTSNLEGVESTERAIQTGQRQPPYELELLTPKGRKIWVRVDESPIVQDGKTVSIVGSLTDITEHKKTEETLRESEARYRLLFNHSSFGILLANTDGQVLEVNAAALQILGSPSTDATRTINLLTFPPLIQAGISADIKDCIEQARPLEVERLYATKWGKSIDALLRYIPIADQDGSVAQVQIIFEDITEAKQAEQALRESEKLLREAQALAGLGNYTLDISTGIWKSSELLDEIFGIDGSYERSISGWEALIHPSDRAMMSEYFATEVIGQGKNFDKEYRTVRHADQSLRWVHGLGKLEFNADGQPVQMHGTIQDITSRKLHQRELEAEAMLAQALSETLELQPLLDQLLDAARHAIPAGEKGSLALMTDDSHLQVMATRGYQPDITGFNYASSWGYGGRAIRQRRPILIEDVQLDAGLYADIRAMKMGEIRELRSAIAVPLLIHDTTIGVLSLESPKPGAFKEEDLRLLINFATSAALIIERARLFDETRRHATETATLLQTSLALADLDLQTTLQTIGTHASALFETDACRIFLTDDADEGALRCVLALGENQAVLLGLKVRLGQGVTGDVAAKGQAEIVNNMGKDPRAVQVPGTPEEEEAIMFAPLKSGDRVIGVMSVKRVGLRHAFTSSDLELLKAFASMSASAVSNARLYEETRQRLSELTTIHHTAQRLTQLHTPDLLAREIVKILEETLHYEYGAVMLISRDGTRLEPFALSDQAHWINIQEKDKAFIDGLSIQIGHGITGWVAQHGQSVRLGDALQDPQYLAVREEIHSELCVPLRIGERVIGIVNVESQRLNAYSESDQRVLETIAAQIAISIHNAELFEGTRQQVTELEMLYESGMQLSQTLSPKEIGERVIQLLGQKMGWHHVTVRLYHPQDDTFELLAFNQPGLTSDTERREVARKFNSLVSGPANGLTGWAFLNSQIVRCGDVRNDPRFVDTHSNLNSGLYMPIRSGQMAIGVLTIESEQPNAFSETDERLAATLANQAASALENARLFEEVRQRVTKLETINRVSIALRAITNQKAILAIVLEEILKALNITVGSIRIWDRDASELRQEAARGWTTELGREAIRSGEGIVGKVFESGETHISRDFYSDPATLPKTRHKMPKNWGGICAPISSSDETLGVLLIAAPSSREFNKEETRLLNTLAEMTGAALHRMNLLNESLRRAQEFEALYETSRVISAEGDLAALLQTIVSSASGMLGASAGGLYLYDSDRREMEVVVATNVAIPVGTRLKMGEGAAGRVAQTRKSLRIDDYSEWEGRSQKLANMPIHAVLEVPITYVGELIGVLAVEEIGDSTRKYSHADERLLTLFASQAAGAIKSTRLHEETLHRLKQLQALRVIDRAIAGSLDKRVTLNILVDQIISQLDADAADVLLLNPYLQTLQFAAGHGFRSRLSETTELHMGVSFAGRAVLERRIQHVQDTATASRNPEFLQFWNYEGFSSYHAVPLIAKGQVIGVIEVFHRSAFQPDSEWINFLETLADQTAIALDNAQMFENVQNVNMELSLAYEATIEGWSRAMDLRDEETEGHTQRVAEMAISLARIMGFDGEELLHVRRGALLHDIGKIGVPDHILHKRGELTEEEWHIMRQHPKFAYDMLLPISYLRTSLDIPYKHHERWDGSGYPQGLAGDQIPLAARIFAVVDVYDALTSDRPYRAAWTHEQTLQYIREESGTRFDPFVVEKFIEVFGVKRA